MSYSCKHWFKRLSKSKLCRGGGGFGGESGYHIQNLNEYDCLEYSNEGGVRVKKNMLLGGRSEGHLLLHKDEWIIHSGFVFQSPVIIDWRCFKFALIHSKLL